MPALKVCGLTRSFGTSRVLSGVDLEVPPGQVVALLGPSGCGKTTLVRLVAGFDRPDGGTIHLAGGAVAAAGAGRATHVPPERRRVGVVPQEGALFSHLDVAGNVGFGLRRGGRTSAGRVRAGQLLDLVGLAGLGKRMPDQLSGGQQQRVAVARALAPRPDLVLLDEPFSALDAALRVSVRDSVVAALRAEAASVLLVTHDQDEALGVADIVAVMLGGRIAQAGPPEEVYTRPISAEVAHFLGEAVVLPGHAHGSSVDCELGRLPLATPAHGPIQVMLRPEQIAAEPAGASDSAATAVVRTRSFHGHDALLALRTDRGTDVQVRLLGGQLPAPGDRVALRPRGTAWPLPR